MTRLDRPRALALAAVLAALGLGLAVVPAPAHAATGQVTDRVDEGFAAEADLVSLQVRNGPRLLRATIGLRELDPSRTSAYAVLNRPGAQVGYVVGTQSTRSGHRAVLVRLGDRRPTPVRCPRLRVRLDTAADLVRVSLPQACLGRDAGTQRVFALTEGPRGNGGDVDSTRGFRVERG